METIPDSLFIHKSQKPIEKAISETSSKSVWHDSFSRLRENRLAMTGLGIIIGLILLSIVGPLIVPYSYSDQSLLDSNLPPSLKHYFGTDDLGRDLFSRTWVGARISLFIGISAVIIDLIVGVLWGGIAAYKGGKIDEVMMRIVDILYGLPHLLITILLMVVLKPGLITIIIAMAATGWVGMARLVRGEILRLKESEFVLASKVLGGGVFRILFKHLIPNAVGPIIVSVTLSVPSAIFAEATLSFLGLGVPVPLASWGTMTSEGLVTLLTGEYWRLLFPACCISLTMFAFNVLGDGLRDALDPKYKR